MARIAPKLGVSASLGSRRKPRITEIDAALHEELKVLKVKLDKYL